MYADNGAFLTVSIALGVALCVIYYHFKDKILKLEQELDLHKQVINKMAEAADQEIAEVRNEMHREDADVINTIANTMKNVFDTEPDKNQSKNVRKHNKNT